MIVKSVRLKPYETRIWQHPGSITTVLLTTLLAGSLIVLASCGNSGSGGKPGNPSTSKSSFKTGVALSSLHMFDASNGWALTQQAVLRTTDGGVHWKDVTPPGHPLVAGGGASFLTASQAWLAIPQANSPTTLIFSTSDGGQTWQTSTAQIDMGNYLQITFVDAQHGWIMNHLRGGPQAEMVEILRTSDGGKSWGQVTRIYPASTDGPPPGKLPYGGSKSGLSFLNASTGWVTGSVIVNNFTWCFVTHDGGSTWNRQTLPPLPKGVSAQLSFMSPQFFTSSDGVLPVNLSSDTSSAFGVYVTHDGGATWSSISLLPTSIASTDFIDANHGWATNGPAHGGKGAGISTLYMTSDGGQHWTQLPANQNFRGITSLDFVSSNIGWAIGRSDTGPLLLKTVDGGRTWTSVNYTVS